ncbi:hypothetical protein NHQ30_010053 [Ciborinia camelliae]|nr:hypothetical protein NHQ30_010053 [Ciborinia camelliae]
MDPPGHSFAPPQDRVLEGQFQHPGHAQQFKARQLYQAQQEYQALQLYQAQQQDQAQYPYQAQQQDQAQYPYQAQQQDQAQQQNQEQYSYQGQQQDQAQYPYQGQQQDQAQHPYQEQYSYQGQQQDQAQHPYQEQYSYQGQQQDPEQHSSYQGQQQDQGQQSYQAQSNQTGEVQLPNHILKEFRNDHSSKRKAKEEPLLKRVQKQQAKRQKVQRPRGEKHKEYQLGIPDHRQEKLAEIPRNKHQYPRQKADLAQPQRNTPQYPKRELKDLPIEESPRSLTNPFSLQHLQSREDPEADKKIDEEELAELEKKYHQEYKDLNIQRESGYIDFCHYFSKRHRGEQINIPDYRATILKLRHENQGLSLRAQVQVLHGIDIENYFKNIEETYFSAKVPIIEKEFNVLSAKISSHPLPPFPPGGPVYRNRVAKLFKIKLECKLQFYTLLPFKDKLDLNVCKVLRQSKNQTEVLQKVHQLQDDQNYTVSVEVDESKPSNFPLPVLEVPSTGKRYEVKCFVEFAEKVTYYYCFDPPLFGREVPLENPEAKEKGLGKLTLILVCA